MKDGRTFYIEMEGYDEKPEIKILIGVDIFVDEKGKILAEIPNKGIRDEQRNITYSDDDLADLEVIISKDEIDERREIDFIIVAKNNGVEKAEDTIVELKLPDGYEFIKAEGFSNSEQTRWIDTGIWEIGTLEAKKERQITIKVKLVEDLPNHRNYTFLAKIFSQTQEATLQNNNMKIGNRVFVVKLSSSKVDLIDLETQTPFAGIIEKEVIETKKFIKKNAKNIKAFDRDCIAYKNCVEIIANRNSRKAMVKIVEQDDGKGGRIDKNNREYGGSVSINDVVREAPPGEISNPRYENAHILLTSDINTKSTFHSHPSGDVVEHNPKGGITKVYFFSKTPSSYDISAAKDGEINYVFARREKIVLIYSNKGVLAVLPHNKFVDFDK